MVRETETNRDRGGGGRERFSFRSLPLMKGCTWMTYHLIVHTSYAREKRK